MGNRHPRPYLLSLWNCKRSHGISRPERIYFSLTSSMSALWCPTRARRHCDQMTSLKQRKSSHSELPTNERTLHPILKAEPTNPQEKCNFLNFPDEEIHLHLVDNRGLRLKEAYYDWGHFTHCCKLFQCKLKMPIALHHVQKAKRSHRGSQNEHTSF